MKKQTIKLNENQLHRLISESVKTFLNERKPSDRTIGKHSFKGLRYDKNGNPLYTSDTLSDEQKKEQGWKYSKKHGLHGQISDPTKISESKLAKLIKESVRKVLKEMDMNTNYSAWSAYLNGREPLFEFEDGIIYVDYDEETGCLCSGSVTNIGFHKDGEVSVPVEDGDFQSALEEVYSELSSNHMPLD